MYQQRQAHQRHGIQRAGLRKQPFQRIQCALLLAGLRIQVPLAVFLGKIYAVYQPAAIFGQLDFLIAVALLCTGLIHKDPCAVFLHRCLAVLEHAGSLIAVQVFLAVEVDIAPVGAALQLHRDQALAVTVGLLDLRHKTAHHQALAELENIALAFIAAAQHRRVLPDRANECVALIQKVAVRTAEKNFFLAIPAQIHAIHASRCQRFIICSRGLAGIVSLVPVLHHGIIERDLGGIRALQHIDHRVVIAVFIIDCRILFPVIGALRVCRNRRRIGRFFGIAHISRRAVLIIFRAGCQILIVQRLCGFCCNGTLVVLQ